MSARPPFHPGDEERIAAEMARELESIGALPGVAPSDGFADRVMLAVAAEPLPQPVRAFRLALFGGHLRAAVASIGDAWRVAMSGFAPAAIRAQALALVLVVVVASVTVAGGVTVGALNLLAPQPTTVPGPSLPAPTRTEPVPERSEQPSATESQSAEPTQSSEPTESAEPTETAEPTEPGKTAEPTETPDANETEQPRTPTPQPTATGTDDHGGGSGSGATPTPTATSPDD